MIEQADTVSRDSSQLIALYAAISAIGVGCGVVAYLVYTSGNADKSAYVLIIGCLALIAYGMSGLFSYLVMLKYMLVFLLDDEPEQPPHPPVNYYRGGVQKKLEE